MADTAYSPLRVAIVGAGPSGFYAAGHLLKNKQMPELVAQVDMFDRLPTPWGLVRGGVAPDHPNIKSVSRVYEKTAALEGFRFFGNVELGRDIFRADLLERYHVVIYAFGAEADRKMGIPGEDLPGSWAATEFVAWYNGHPDYRELEFDLSGRRAVVIGNGNVAVDVARMLALSADELAQTDIADHALEALRESQIEEVVMLGRRGPAQGAFTTPELLELGELADADIVVDPQELELDEHSERWLEQADATRRKNVEVLRQYAERERNGKRRRVVLRFLSSPVGVVGGESVSGVEVVRNELRPLADGALRAHATDIRETLEAGIVFRSIGYRGVAIDTVPFDERAGTIPNQAGRVRDPDGSEPLPGEYAVGWIKRGPTGVIGTNKKDAQETVDSIIEDLREGRLPQPQDPDPEAVVALLRERAPRHVDYGGWQAIDAAEQAAGSAQDRPRVKLCTFEELLAASTRTASSV